MTQSQLILVCEKLLGWKWYRHPSANSLKNPHYRFLAHPSMHEIDQSPQWMVPADMTEKPCTMEYMENEFYLPKLTLDLMWECEEKLSKEEFTDKLGFIWSQRCEYMSQLERIVIRDSNKIKCNFEFYHATKEQRLAALVQTIC